MSATDPVKTTAVGKAVEALRKERGWTLRELAALMGTTHATLSRKEAGKISILPPERRRFAEVFGMTLEEFDQHWRASTIPQTRGGLGIPLINKTSAGVVVNYEEWGMDSGQGFEYLDRDAQTMSDLLFAVEIVGDSMLPELREGDRVVFHPLDRETKRQGQPNLEPGDIVFVRFSPEIGDGCTVALYYPMPDGQIQLRKLNAKYPARTVSPDNIVNMAVFQQMRRDRIKG